MQDRTSGRTGFRDGGEQLGDETSAIHIAVAHVQQGLAVLNHALAIFNCDK